MKLFECCLDCTIRYPGCSCKSYKADKEKHEKIKQKKRIETDYDLFMHEKRVRRDQRLGGLLP